jgi:hypothetical protein
MMAAELFLLSVKLGAAIDEEDDDGNKPLLTESE